MLKELKENKIFYISILLFIIITLPFMLTHRPHCDEAQNYMVSYFMDFSNWIKISSHHGHPLLWYLILMPFSKTNFMYPYPMLILNYIFLLAALVVMWKKAPFDDVYKIIITFSFMMVSYFAIVARCYTIGLLGIFLICALYKDKLKHPILYSIIIGLTANTSAMAAITVIPITAIFFYDMYKKKEEVTEIKIVYAFFILFAFACLFLYPFISTAIYHFEGINKFSYIVNQFFIPIENNFIFLISYIFVFLYLLFIPKDVKSKIFLISSTGILWIFFAKVYTCLPYHRFFFFIFFIVTMWLQNFENKKDLLSYVYIVAFSILLMMPQDLSSCNGYDSVFEFGKTLKSDSSKYDNSIIAISDFGMEFELAPFIIQNAPNVKLYGVTDFYSYKMDERTCNDDFEEIQKFAKTRQEPVYILTDRTLDGLELFETFKDLNIYKAN